MSGEGQIEDASSGSIVKAVSAFHYFQRAQMPIIREEVIRDGGDASVGSLTSMISVKWKSLTDEERLPYTEQATADRLRYEDECAKRDIEVALRQEERRKAHSVGDVTDTRMRNSTIKYTEASAEADAKPRQSREMSEEQRAKIAARRAAKAAEEAATRDEEAKLQAFNSEQAESRLKFLLNQSEIFAHFSMALGGKKATQNVEEDRRRGGTDDLDEDEAAMADEENNNGTILLQQPRCIQFGQMRPYQLEGLNWMIRLRENGINGILADEMGLGKTLQSISILGYMYEYQDTPGPHIVLVPKSTLPNWCNEFERWCPALRILRLHGSKEERQSTIEQYLSPSILRNQTDLGWDVLVTTYEVLNMEHNNLLRIPWCYLIIDEAHRLKNEQSIFSKNVRELKTKHRILITGTPLQNNLHELWALLNFLLPDIFSSSEQFDEWFNLKIDDNEAKAKMISQLHKLLRPFMLRRLKADVEKSLPPKNELILFTGMSEMQRNLYKQLLSRNVDTINSAATSASQQSRTAVLNIVMQLRKCCNHPYLFPNVEDRNLDPHGEHVIDNCGKMVLLDKLLKKMRQRGHRVLLFTQMTRMLDIFEDYLISRGYRYCRIDGNTSYEDREDRIADYNRPDSDKFIFILSTRAGGLGINLQTADTVILYDSDWNPQADLQAQDRAHRIGQKKPVQVFRLVTDDSVEVKVVERAQQKLKLDAMVVQQGRLSEKEKKLSKGDLLDTLKFGADKIFRSKESTISDADIEMILEEGRKRTAELNEKLQAADKGDLYDFKLDGGGLGSQVFEGKDYATERKREADSAYSNLLLIDMGKRDRRTVSYADSGLSTLNGNNSIGNSHNSRTMTEEERRTRLPRHLRLPKMEDWQFFNKTRLNELQAEELRLYSLLWENETPSQTQLQKLTLLSPEETEEKTKLLEEGFGHWTRFHYNNFIKSSARHGRSAYDKISDDMGLSIDEVSRYATVFWSRAATELAPTEYERVLRHVEKGEKRLEEIDRLTSATARLTDMFDDPWEQLQFKHVGNVHRMFTAVEDRFLLCLTRRYGYGAWDQIRHAIRRCERFRFDLHLQSYSTEAIGKRCEALMRSAERELLEIERKQAMNEAVNDGREAAAASMSSSKATSSAIFQQRLLEVTRQLSEESSRLVAAKTEILKIKSLPADASGLALARELADDTLLNSESGTNGTGNATGTTNSVADRAARATYTRFNVVPVPEALYPNLCRTIVAGGADGVSRLAEKFLERFPKLSRRQVELKIGELAVKEKRGDDSSKVWYLRPEFTHLLDVTPVFPVDNSTTTIATPSTSSVTTTGSGNTAQSTPIASSTKRKLPTKGEAGAENPVMPRRPERAFSMFARSKNPELRAQGLTGEAMREQVAKLWDEADPSVKALFERREQVALLSYERRLNLWKQHNSGATPSTPSSQVDPEEPPSKKVAVDVN